MNLDPKYFEEIKIKKTVSTFAEGDLKIEEDLMAEVYNKALKKNQELSCFIPDHEDFGKFKEGTKAKAELKQITFDTFSNPKKEKKIIFTQKYPKANQCKIFGQIIEIKQHPSYATAYLGVIYCGFYVSVEVYKDKNPEKGDYIMADGRLDAHFIKEI